ncbi:MAG: helix-turn-helix domain-containing protein [Oscillospiraceae bacterium]|nr:helix-turn-helix domain-containing protein [Oscillospiraceae bacterium]
MVLGERYLTVKDLQKKLNISRTKAYQLVNQPDFPKLKIGRDIRIPETRLEEFLGSIIYHEYEL